MRAVGMVTAILLLAVTALSQEKPADPDTPERFAARVVEVFDGGDTETLEVLARRPGYDPWMIADELYFRGNFPSLYGNNNVLPSVPFSWTAEFVYKF